MSDATFGAGMYVEFLTKVGVDRLSEIVGKTLRKPCAISVEDGRFLWANRSWCNMLGYTLDELTDLVKWDKLTADAEDLEADKEQLSLLKLGSNDSYEIIKFYRGKAGNRIHVKLVVTRFPQIGTIDWFFVEAEVLGDEYREAFLYATDQVANLAKTFAEKHIEIVSRVDKLIGQQEQIITLWTKDQFWTSLPSNFFNWVGNQYDKNPLKTTAVGVVLLTLVCGTRVIDVIKQVASLFSITLGAP